MCASTSFKDLDNRFTERMSQPGSSWKTLLDRYLIVLDWSQDLVYKFTSFILIVVLMLIN